METKEIKKRKPSSPEKKAQIIKTCADNFFKRKAMIYGMYPNNSNQ